MVEKYPYRVLSSYSYDFDEKSLRSERVGEKPPLEVVSDVESVMEPRTVPLPYQFKEVSKLQEHSEFIQKLINGKVLAVMTNGPSEINWRGYTTTMTPDFDMTTNNLKKELLIALQSLTTISEMERQVLKND